MKIVLVLMLTIVFINTAWCQYGYGPYGPYGMYPGAYGPYGGWYGPYGGGFGRVNPIRGALIGAMMGAIAG
uniref:Uncharacterized protein n=1 Tax=Angiostrongylus cantonensis TaxID=6313 RepID=A0A0K0D8J2_ANGCA